jgi:hypothetical protein
VLDVLARHLECAYVALGGALAVHRLAEGNYYYLYPSIIIFDNNLISTLSFILCCWNHHH